MSLSVFSGFYTTCSSGIDHSEPAVSIAKGQNSATLAPPESFAHPGSLVAIILSASIHSFAAMSES